MNRGGIGRNERPEIWLLTGEFERELASGLRQERWAGAFLEAGASVRVLNLRGALGFEAVRFKAVDEVGKFRRARAPKNPRPSLREGRFAPIFRRLKHLTLVDLYYPSVFRLWFYLIRNLLFRRHRVAIVASSPPFSLALMGAFAKRLRPAKVYFTVDMRDAWALHSYLHGFRPLRRAIEHWVFAAADDVTTVSRGLADELENEHRRNVGLVYNVATHYLDKPEPGPPPDWRSISPAIAPGSTKLVYTGTMPEGFYDLGALGEGLRRSEGALIRHGVQFVFAGGCRIMAEEVKRREIASDTCLFVNHQPHAIARGLQHHADALLFLAHRGEKNAGVVSTKFFEYLATGRPILPIGVAEGSDVDELLTRLCGRTMQIRTPEAIAESLERIAREGVAHLPRLSDEAGLRCLYNAYRAMSRNVVTRLGA